MERISQIMTNIQTLILKRTEEKFQQEKSTTTDLFDCEKCKDIGYIYNKLTDTARICECQEVKKYKKILEMSGISAQFKKIGFKEFETTKKFQVKAKKQAIDYVKNFDSIVNERNNSIAFLGNCGSGKTHLSIAIANNLMAKNIAVLYMPYREVITKIKQVILDDISYSKILNNYKTAKVLLIDDFAKGKTTEADINIMFEIINYRYLNHMPIILSSELTQDRLLNFDEAVGSRIIEMCKNRINEAVGIETNYRLVKRS